ncbi:MAG: hypothetical protein U9R57_05050 [Thermodesulfobacteriota bacterium]|nr:hypothetical protein [Thermodesulfobacteriota bacterium]
MGDFFANIWTWVESTHIQEQVADVDYAGLFSNPWFMVPFVSLVLYLLYKQSFKDLIIISAFIGVWWVSGTEYMHTLVVGDELQVEKVLPVLFGGAAMIGGLIYMIFGRSD